MRRIAERMKRKSGETLIESLVSILIFTCASIIMLTMITAAGDINRRAKDADRAHFSQMTAAEMAEGEAVANGTVTFTVNGVSESVCVDVYGQGTDLYAYYATEPTGGDK